MISIAVQAQEGKFRKIQKYIDDATERLAGVSVYLKSPEMGEWVGVSGYSNLEEGQLLKREDVFGLASIGKMYVATAAVKLAQEGKYNLDDKISKYLSKEIIENIPNAEIVTIRQLLMHTSGFVDYERDTTLNRIYLEGKLSLDTLSHMEALERYMFGKPSLNVPGEEFHYSSTNYMLVTMVMDKVLEEGHEKYVRNLLSELNLHKTWYKETPPNLINHYGDINKDAITENLTAQTIELTNWLSGDDGIYATIDEAALFLQKLVKGEIVNEEFLKEMTTWNAEKNPDYGLGLEVGTGFPYRLTFGHSGSGISMRTDLYYFPKKDMTVAVFSNSGLRSASREYAKAYYKMVNRIVFKLFLF